MANFTNPGEFKKKLEERLKWTPDFGIWRNFHSMTVFIADELKSGFTLNGYLDGAQFLGKSLSMAQHYELRRGQMSNRPALFWKDPSDPFSAQVRGELWLINVEHLHVLDNFYQNGREHTREVHNFFALYELDPDEMGNYFYYRMHPHCKAFVYLGIEDYWKTKNMVAKKLSTGYDNEHTHPLLKGTQFYEWDFMDENDMFAGDEYPLGRFSNWSHVG